jgi:hypothetical protein
MDEFGAADSLTSAAFDNVSKSVCKKVPLFPSCKNWPCLLNALSVPARRPPDLYGTSTSSLYGTDRVLDRDYALIQSSTIPVITSRRGIGHPTRSISQK